LPHQYRNMAKQSTKENNLSTEEKFKEAARIVFTKKGYAATKTRDIAEQAGLNLALLNYYFRSKEKLFEIIMLEKVQELFAAIAPVLHNTNTTLDEKIDQIAENYITLLLKNPGLPLFVLSEINRNPERFAKTVQVENLIMQSHFVQQLLQKNTDINPVQFVISYLGMLIFPFVAKPVLQASHIVTEEIFTKMMEERKSLTAKWMKMIIG
jgi:AcrR family transcriptional regulator